MKIEFQTIEGFEWMPKPVPASECIPDWYRKMPRRVEETPPGSFPLGTAKLCSPFLDAMTAGYMLRLPFQCFVRADGEQINMSWINPSGQSWQLVDQHARAQMPGTDFIEERATIFKWMLPFGVKMPEGYAALYTHPINRPDLPFQTFSGLVDAAYDSAVNIPFLWIAGEQETILDGGTPIAQLIPVKLDEWEHAIENVTDDKLRHASRVASTYITGYRRLFRRDKSWK